MVAQIVDQDSGWWGRAAGPRARWVASLPFVSIGRNFYFGLSLFIFRWRDHRWLESVSLQQFALPLGDFLGFSIFLGSFRTHDGAGWGSGFTVGAVCSFPLFLFGCTFSFASAIQKVLFVTYDSFSSLRTHKVRPFLVFGSQSSTCARKRKKEKKEILW